jgi:myosin heavy subunit
MNPTMLEASDDLTNLSHLNEPAGTSLLSTCACLPSIY